MDNNEISKVKAIRDFFGNVTMDEMKALTAADREELGSACAHALGKTLAATAG